MTRRSQRRLEALPGMHCNSLILSISRDAPSLFDQLSLCSRSGILLKYKLKIVNHGEFSYCSWESWQQSY
jgi:hypothetical protein